MMDRALKERIIGAIVLVAVVVLVVPVFLDGPVDESAVVSERINLPGQGGDDGIRTVVLDRDRSEPVPATPQPARAPTRARWPASRRLRLSSSIVSPAMAPPVRQAWVWVRARSSDWRRRRRSEGVRSSAPEP